MIVCIHKRLIELDRVLVVKMTRGVGRENIWRYPVKILQHKQSFWKACLEARSGQPCSCLKMSESPDQLPVTNLAKKANNSKSSWSLRKPSSIGTAVLANSLTSLTPIVANRNQDNKQACAVIYCGAGGYIVLFDFGMQNENVNCVTSLRKI